MLTHFLDHCRRPQSAGALRKLEKLCWRLLSEAGAANSAAIAIEIMGSYSKLPQPARLAFFQFLDIALRPDAGKVLDAATSYASNSDDPGRVLALQRAVEPPRQELLRRINRSDGGTAAIIAMRRDLLSTLRQHSQLSAVDSDFRHLLASWFNPGFLALQQVDWHAPAALLEKIIRHEAVHAVTNWADLRRRLQADRRCFAFFHPQIPGQPLIFVEVALGKAMPRSIHPLVNEHAPVESAHDARVAAFYSISNCEPGLAGVSLGNFLIKRVAERLKSELPVLKRFCTLSPIPALRAWMTHEPSECKSLDALRMRYGNDLRALADAVQQNKLPAADRARLEECAAIFLTRGNATDLGDPVARFHLDNGARLERINVGADLSVKGLRNSFGVMVNYLYELSKVESNHEHFVNGRVVRSRQVNRLCRHM